MLIPTDQGTHTDTPEALAVSNQASGRGVTTAYARDKHLLMGKAPQVAIEAGGIPVGPDATPRQAFAAAGADFLVEPRPLAYDQAIDNSDVSDWRCLSTHKAIVRTDTGTPLGVVGRGYTPIQNEALINLFEFLREDSTLQNIVVMHGGRKVVASASISIEGEVIPGSPISRRLHAFNSHDGTSAFGVFFSDMVWVCANQISYITGRGARRAASAGRGLTARHTSGAPEFARRLPDLIDLQSRTFRQSLEDLKPLTTLRLSSQQTRAILETTYSDKLAQPIKDRHSGEQRPRTLADLEDTVISTIRSHTHGTTGMGIDPTDRSAWNLFMGITQFETHDAGRLKDPVASARARLESLWGGAGSARIERAREALLAQV